LLLADREAGAALAHLGGVAGGQALDEAVGVHLARGPADALFGDALAPEADVALDGAAEEEDVLEDDGEVLAQGLQVPLAHVHAVEQYRAALHVVEAHEEVGDGRLARAGVADERDRLAGLDREGDALENPLVLLVGEPHVAELDAALGAPAFFRPLRRGHGDGQVERAEDAVRGDEGRLEDVVPVRDVADGLEEALRILDEGDERADG
jgi:hypothetical protein